MRTIYYGLVYPFISYGITACRHSDKKYTKYMEQKGAAARAAGLKRFLLRKCYELNHLIAEYFLVH
jgi:hypothetical protein